MEFVVAILEDMKIYILKLLPPSNEEHTAAATSANVTDKSANTSQTENPSKKQKNLEVKLRKREESRTY